jgi:F-type H+-transporting ATPase subunit b
VSINVTLIAQMLAFGFLIWFTMKFIWPPLTKAMADRAQRIADGLAAAEKGTRALEEAAARSEEQLQATRGQAQDILGTANRQATQIVEQARAQAKAEGERIVAAARGEVERQVQQAREQLRKQVGDLAVLGAARILKREVNAQAHGDVLKELAERI